MTPEKRRSEIMDLLEASDHPVSASVLASKFNVSRQVIVGDVALLRAEGDEVMATPRGYVLSPDPAEGFGFVGTVATKHKLDRLREELYIIVDFGGTAIDVTIEHPLYGQLSGPLDVSSRYDVDLFCEKVKLQGSQPLSTLTDGIHTHRIGCRDITTFQKIKSELEKAGLTYK